MEQLTNLLQEKIHKRITNNYLRELSNEQLPIDFCSNDYLGFAKNTSILSKLSKISTSQLGSTGSRLISGNSKLITNLEERMADFFQAENALLFNSGYDANIGLIGCIGEEGDTILYDYLSHASMRDGLKLSRANTISFQHNELHDLALKLQQAKGRKIILIESIYSMDGDEAPLQEIVALAEQYQAAIIVDEAHSTGIYGEKGEGLAIEKGVASSIFARVHTFGKAFGAHGAVVVGSKLLKKYLVNYARSFVFTTALPAHSIHHLNIVLDELEKTNAIHQLKTNIDNFKTQLSDTIKQKFIPSNSPIQSLVIGGNEATKKMALQLRKKGLDIRPILYPSVPLGKERIRICLHATNSEDEIKLLCESLNALTC